ncbi:RNA polymerase II subunit A [Penicillium chermesinum]|uniref:RNA polymerase II subunit A C-terminal domain phosphatase SSU72 n=1 Tax=Penicillium chermesinum TaxID=63820 RepID=A0A9W9NYJ0_9EURO|nr:RNA polymerase II subunit A [Penicillium chermesinum]KAJ5232143.1 RNA polymerase II subunit A [Penicillium chermesinum]KAJ6171807.1 RNA polymerase II subunit A [Penicillium chermesinum]
MAYDPRRVNTGSTTPQTPPPPPPPPTDMNSGQAPSSSTDWKLKFCTVCASNNNRSMEAHLRLSSAPTGFPVISFGTGSLVRLPGPSITQPNVYSFNTTSYNQMYEELQSKDERLYRNNGILNMLDRNRNLKWGPERFQDWVPGVPRLDHLSKGDKGALGTEGGVVDVIITCEERCWDAVVDDLMNKGAALNRPVHVFNVDIKDNHEEALVGGKAILDLANRLNDAATAQRALHGNNGWENGAGAARKSFDEQVPEILAEWQELNPSLPALWTLAWL